MQRQRGEDEEDPLARHMRDPFAHPQHEERIMIWTQGQLVERRRFVDERLAEQEGRLNRHERFIEQLKGGLLVIGAAIGGGVLTFLLHLAGGR